MRIEKLKTRNQENLEGILICIPNIFEDQRGFFYESWNQKIFNEIISQEISFVQDNHSRSKKGVIRGLHYQLPPSKQGKLIRCTSGEIFDVVVDLRANSATFGKWGGEILSILNKKLLWIPPGFAHGFLTLSDSADVQYKVTSFWDSTSEKTIKWDDPSLNIEWPFNDFGIYKPLLSPKDELGILLEDAKKAGYIFQA